MEDKKKVNVSSILLVIAIIVIVIQAIFNYQFCSEKKIAEERVESLTNQIANLEGNVGNYRRTLDEIAVMVNDVLNPVEETEEPVVSGEEVTPVEEVTDSGEEPAEVVEENVEENVEAAPVVENSEVI